MLIAELTLKYYCCVQRCWLCIERAMFTVCEWWYFFAARC